MAVVLPDPRILRVLGAAAAAEWALQLNGEKQLQRALGLVDELKIRELAWLDLTRLDEFFC